jgi:ubiquinone/menaquinone biosynthesis C-methylase UbiE
MLEETRRRCVEEDITPPELIRCDVSRLPFASGSLDAVHAGAAMHCWPRLASLTLLYFSPFFLSL